MKNLPSNFSVILPGVTASYDEVLRFRASATHAASKRKEHMTFPNDTTLIYSRVLGLHKMRYIDIESVLKYELVPVPHV